jgi:hypothetical protein
LIGIVSYELLIGHIPFDPGAIDYAAQVQNGATLAMLAAIPVELRSLFRRLLAPRPHQRFARFDQIRSELTTASGALGCT